MLPAGRENWGVCFPWCCGREGLGGKLHLIKVFECRLCCVPLPSPHVCVLHLCQPLPSEESAQVQEASLEIFRSLHRETDSFIPQKVSKNIFALAIIFISPTCLQAGHHLHGGLNSKRENGYERKLHVCMLIRTGQSME